VPLDSGQPASEWRLGHDLEQLADALELRFPDIRPVRPFAAIGNLIDGPLLRP
jgi:hypothetical protein